MMGKNVSVTKDTLVPEVQKLAEAKARFITATCLDLGDQFQVYYSFDQDLQEVDLQLMVGKDEEVPSITGQYLCALLIENEMKELFGMKVKDIAIDFGGKMLLTDTSPQLPMVKAVKKSGEDQKGGE